MFLEVKSTYKPNIEPAQEAATQSRLCTWCAEEKPLSAFTVRPHSKSGVSKRCTACLDLRKGMRQIGKTGMVGKPSPATLKKEYILQRCRPYDLTSQQYYARVKEQNGFCAICRKEPTRTLHIDHHHETGIVRGLLCRLCNFGLGMFQDSPLLLKAAAEYIERSPTTSLRRLKRLA